MRPLPNINSIEDVRARAFPYFSIIDKCVVEGFSLVESIPKYCALLFLNFPFLGFKIILLFFISLLTVFYIFPFNSVNKNLRKSPGLKIFIVAVVNAKININDNVT